MAAYPKILGLRLGQGVIVFKKYTHVKFSYGYTKRTMTFEIESIKSVRATLNGAHLDFHGNEGGVWEAGIKDLRPIPITKEVLRRVGFRWDGCYGHKQLDDAKTMQYYKHESRLRVWYKTEDFIFECHGVHHLHQLQNAYYMATGEELGVHHED